MADVQITTPATTGLGAGLALVGGGFGIARLAAAAMEGIARQPEAAGDIKGGMIITAAFIEGVTFFGIAVCLILALNLGGLAETLVGG